MTFVYGHQRGFKSGQVDALTGKVLYELIENSDKTSDWVLIKEEL